jgi:hypothetical protein
MKKISILICVFVYSIASAQTDAGKTGLSFLKIGVGAGETALAEAVSSRIRSPFALTYNPALLSFFENPNVGFMHNEWIQDVKSEFLISNFSLFGVNMAASVNSTNISEIEVRTRPGEKEGSFTAHYLNIGIGSAFKLNEDVSFGFNFKFLYENIFEYEASGFGLDVGLLHRNIFSRFNLGVALRNLGSMSKLNQESTKLPTELRIGASYNEILKFADFSFTPSLDIQKYFPADGFPILIGVEADYAKNIFLRVGYRTGRELNGFSAGIGLSWKGIQADYAFVPFSQNFSSANIFSIYIAL